jgi:hypothetical protein
MRILMILAIGLLPALGFAKSPEEAEPVIPPERLSPAGITALAQEIRTGMDAGGRFEWVSASERETVTRDLDVMVDVLADQDSVDALKPDERVALFNAQASANEILGLRDGNRMVCERRKRTGSNRSELHCERYAERMERTRGDRRAIDDVTRRGQSAPARDFWGQGSSNNPN